MSLCEKSCDGRPCTDPETGEMCAQCEATIRIEMAMHRAEYDRAILSERDPRAYAEELVEAGRGHLLTEDERALVRR